MTQMIAIDARALEAIERKLDTALDAIAKLSGEAEWMAVEEAAQKANNGKGVSVSTVNRWVQAGIYEARGSGKSRVVRPVRG